MLKQKQCFSLLLAAFCLLFALPALAQEALLSSDVTMDVTGADANEARTKAMHQAERDGLDQLLSKLAPEQKDALMSKLSDDIISAMVKSVEVEDEKIAGNRYRASLRVSYNALAVNTLLDKKVGAEAAPVKVPSAVLVIPLYVDGAKTMLWEPNNAWREAWRRAILETSGGNVLVPYGDSTDTAALSTDAVMSANYGTLATFFSRYGVGAVIIVKATFHKSTGAKDQLATMDVIRRDIGQQTNDSYVLDYRADQDEDKAALLLRVARDLIEQVNRQREEILTREAMTGTSTGADTGRIMVLIPTTTLDSWTKVRAQLTKLQTVTKLDVLAVSPQQVDTMLQFKGPKASLASDIAALGLRVQQFDNYWVVSRE